MPDAFGASVAQDVPHDIAFRILRPDRDERVIHSRGDVFRDETGKPTHMSGAGHDITERRRADENLRTSEARFRLVVEQAPDAILLYDVDRDRLTDANKAAERLFACARGEIVKYGPRHFYAPEQPDARPVANSFAEHNARVVAGEELAFERRIRNAAGQERLCRVTLVRLPWAGARLIRASFIDITEQREAERALQRLNRALRTLRRGNEVLVHAESEPELLSEMCRAIVETGGHRMAWIGIAQHDAAKSVTPGGAAGAVGDYLDKAPDHLGRRTARPRPDRARDPQRRAADHSEHRRRRPPDAMAQS
ncbi:MAG TPA: PAS domain S-box protein, partial [Stellaceae bacterium]|nr:PAS domain S-box protein [Stellaceae bacterium]